MRFKFRISCKLFKSLTTRPFLVAYKIDLFKHRKERLGSLYQ